VRLIAAGLAFGPAALLAQDGTVTGRVTDKATGAGVSSAQVRVVGGTAVTVTNDSGYYRLHKVPLGPQTVRALRLGYAASSVTVTVTAGPEVRADIALMSAAAILTTQTITATGQKEEARQTAVYVPSISPDSINLAASPNMASVLESEIPGVTVEQSSGTVGTGVRVRIRGSNSVSLSNEPLIVIDGVEVANSETGFNQGSGLNLGVGGQEPSRLNDLDPNEIESVETLQGPAATGLYGTAAANGVLVITTKRGKPGKPVFDLHISNGTLRDENPYPASYGSGNGCGVLLIGLGACTTIDSVYSYNPFFQAANSPLRIGRDQQYGLNVSGGSDVNSYFISGNYQRTDGTLNTNMLEKTNSRANYSARPTDDLSLNFSSGYVYSNTRFPQNDNNVLGVISEELLSPGTPANGNDGYFGAVNPTQTLHIHTFQEIQRFMPALNIAYDPLKWLDVIATGGFDISSQNDNQWVDPNSVQFGSYPLGSANDNRLQTQSYTLSTVATAHFDLPAKFTTSTSIGATWRRTLTDGNFGFGYGLVAGTSSLHGVTQLFAVDEETDDERTLGGFLQEQVGWRGKMFLTGGVRVDKTSTQGPSAGDTYYPEVNGAWDISDEEFFPKQPVVSTVKLRAALGQSGLRPSLYNALTYYNPSSVTLSGPPAIATTSSSVGGFTTGGVGDPNLKPERTTEWEVGADFGLIKDRFNGSVTYYHKNSTDALVAVPLYPSIGSATSEYENLGSVLNRGLELQIGGKVIDFGFVRLDFTASYATLENFLESLGANQSPIVFGLGGATQRMTPGYQLGAYFQQTYTYTTPTNGILTPANMTYSAQSEFVGNDIPTHTATFAPSLTIFKWLKVGSLFDFRGGYKLYNATADFRCGRFLNCASDYDLNAPLSVQAASLADATQGSVAGYIVNARFWKWREASITAILPSEWATFIRARTASLTFAARNLRTWTNYTGLDPEVSEYGQDNFTSADFLTQPPVRYYTVRFNLTY